MSDSTTRVLYGGPNSPYARMARVVGEELGVDFEYRIVDVYSAEFLDAHNPLRQIPTLIENERTAVYDSRTIFVHFALCAGRPEFVHLHDIEQTTRTALALGLTDVCLGYRMESIRPDGERSDAVLGKLAGKLERGLRHMDGLTASIAAGPLRLEQVVVGCMLEYVDYRYGREWRAECPGLADWLAAFGARETMQASQPYG